MVEKQNQQKQNQQKLNLQKLNLQKLNLQKLNLQKLNLQKQPASCLSCSSQRSRDEAQKRFNQFGLLFYKIQR